MNASIPQSRGSLSHWSSRVVWVSAFLSPTAYFLLLLLASKSHINVPGTLAGSLFFLIPLVALLICESVVWSGSKTVGRRIGWMLLTLLAMSFQFAILLAMLRAILVTAIGYAQ